jgi:hypothetical protein
MCVYVLLSLAAFFARFHDITTGRCTVENPSRFELQVPTQVMCLLIRAFLADIWHFWRIYCRYMGRFVVIHGYRYHVRVSAYTNTYMGYMGSRLCNEHSCYTSKL